MYVIAWLDFPNKTSLTPKCETNVPSVGSTTVTLLSCLEMPEIEAASPLHSLLKDLIVPVN